MAYRIEALQAYLRDFPDIGWVWLILGGKLIEVSRFADAEHALRRALQLLSPDDHCRVYCSLGQLFRHRGDPPAAEARYRNAIALRPDEAEAYIYQGATWARLGRFEEAEASHRRATCCKTGCIDEAHHNLGLVLRRVGERAVGRIERPHREPQGRVRGADVGDACGDHPPGRGERPARQSRTRRALQRKTAARIAAGRGSPKFDSS